MGECMDIVIVANFCMDFSEADNGRFSYLASQLIESNNDVEIITSSFFHITKSHRGSLKKYPYKITLIDEPGYEKNISIRRFFSHMIWGKNVIDYIKKRKKPDVIYCAIPSLTAPYFVAKYCEKNGVRFIIDIQDLWPEAFQMVLNNQAISKIVFFPLKLFADAIYKRADDVAAVSQSYVDRALSVNKKNKYGYAVYLGTSLEKFDLNASNDIHVQKEIDEIWIAYCGTLGKSYDLKCVIDAIHIVGNNKVKLVVMGDGPQKNEFEMYAKEKKINSIFCGRLSYDTMCALLSACDITVNPIIGTSVASIINKHADYAAVGLPVINTQESVEYRNLINEFGMGINCKSGDAQDVAKAIELLMGSEELRKKYGAGSRKCALEKFDRKVSYRPLIEMILSQ